MRTFLTVSVVTAAFLLFPARGYCRDATVGSCTQKESFAKSQERTDAMVAQLTSAPEAKQPGIGSSIAGKFGSSCIENLIRYREPAMKHVFLALLNDKKWPVRARALYGLKMTGDASCVEAIGKALADKEVAVREMAANALCHIGDDAALEILRKHAESEKDPYVKASIDAAISVLTAGAKPYASYKGGKTWSETLEGPAGVRRVQWEWVKRGEQLFNDYDAKWCELPIAEKWSYPVSEYKKDLFATGFPRKSFGAGGNHAADDCAWFREGCSYYAIADGVVRMVQGAGGDWGFLLVLEHLMPSGDYIVSLYGHAGWDVLVKPGDMVKAGQKIATEGLSCSIENGGYGSHIHVGIGDGPFRRSKIHEKGSKMSVEDSAGRKADGTIVRIVYAKGTKDSYGFPRLTAVVKTQGGELVEKTLDDEDIKDQIAWMQAYIAECKGWLNPETFLPEHVEGAGRKGK